MQVEALKNTLAFTLEHVRAKHLPHWVMWRARQTTGKKLSDLEAYVMANRKADTLAEAKAKTL